MAVPWQAVEPAWWLDMMELRRKMFKIKEIYGNNGKV